MRRETLDMILAGNAKKGDVIATARIAGIMAAKRTHELIPAVPSVDADKGVGRHRARPALPGLRVSALTKVTGKTGCRDGGADRRVGNLPDDLRHGESG
jgi:cyclic pyranopterin phosphate synthase